MMSKRTRFEGFEDIPQRFAIDLDESQEVEEGITTWEKIELDANDAQLLNSYLNDPPVANAALQRSIVEHQQKYGQWWIRGYFVL
jgi:uncharacterized protein (DUF1778 family)